MNLTVILHLAEVSMEVLGGVCILATIVARLTPTKKDDAIVESMDNLFFKVMNFLPTLGINPNTQKVKDALVDAQAKLDAANAPVAPTPAKAA
jgi:hypothetical protein